MIVNLAVDQIIGLLRPRHQWVLHDVKAASGKKLSGLVLALNGTTGRIVIVGADRRRLTGSHLDNVRPHLIRDRRGDDVAGGIFDGGRSGVVRKAISAFSSIRVLSLITRSSWSVKSARRSA